MISQVLLEQHQKKALDAIFFCEVTSNTVLEFENPESLDLENLEYSDVNVDKQLGKQKNSVKLTNCQLGYAALSTNDDTGSRLDHMQICHLTKYQVMNFDTVFGKKKSEYGIKGLNSFNLSSIRDVAYINNLYVYHANSSTHAAVLVPWVATQLLRTEERFVLFGDFNCEPDTLKATLAGALPDLSIHSIATINDKTYDYAIAIGYTVDMNVVELKKADNPSDHLPIILDITGM